MKRHIVCFHLLNDFSGSPKVLHNVLEGLLNDGCEIDLITSRGGVLDSLAGDRLKRRSYSYAFSSSPAVTMLRYTVIQILTFFMALRYLFRRDVIFYINTILPVGPALAGRLMGKRVIYHYHENAFVKSRFYITLARIMERIAHHIICVSSYQASFLERRHGVSVVPNALSPEFTDRLHPAPSEAFDRKTVLMLSSLKAYKGTHEFLQLATLLPEFKFVLVINDTPEAIAQWMEKEHITLTDNVTLRPRTSDVASLYNSASLVLNLSDPSLFIETFGLTALEAMSCGLPVIVPPVGGIAEMVTDGGNGYKIDCKDTDRLVATISLILTERELYQSLSREAIAVSRRFNRDAMLKNISSRLFN